MVNITNDAWYGQHLAMAVFRAVEHGAYLIRSANTGISAIVDGRGRVREQSAIFTETVPVGKISGQAERTVYTRFGDLFAWAATAGSAGGAFWRPAVRQADDATCSTSGDHVSPGRGRVTR